jgi:RNA polymerase sigma factor (sigma-70 family)
MTPATPPLTADPGSDPVKAALGDPQTLEELRKMARVFLRRGRPGITRSQLAQLVDDVISRAAETALDKRALFDPARGSKVSSWLVGHVQNAVRKEACPRQPRRARPVDWETVFDPAPTPVDQVASRAEQERLRFALERLAGRDRQLVEWHYFDGLTAVQIGARLDTSPSNVRVWLHRARKEVEELLTPPRQEGDS